MYPREQKTGKVTQKPLEMHFLENKYEIGSGEKKKKKERLFPSHLDFKKVDSCKIRHFSFPLVGCNHLVDFEAFS